MSVEVENNNTIYGFIFVRLRACTGRGFYGALYKPPAANGLLGDFVGM